MHYECVKRKYKTQFTQIRKEIETECCTNWIILYIIQFSKMLLSTTTNSKKIKLQLRFGFKLLHFTKNIYIFPTIIW